MKGHNPHELGHLPVLLLGKNIILHYTCNSPSEEILTKHGITAIGDKFNCKDKREVLSIPIKNYKEYFGALTEDKDLMQLNLEKYLKNLG